MRTYIEFEQRHHRIASWGRFVWRLFRNLSIAVLIIATALLGGMAGYAVLARLPNPSLPGGIHGPLPLLLIVLTTGFGGWLAAYAASRLLRRRAD